MMTGRTNYTGVSNTDAFAPPADITTAYEHFDPLIGEAVSLTSSLPDATSWRGRAVYVQAPTNAWDKGLYVSNGATWDFVAPVPTAVTIATANFGSGWSAVSPYNPFVLRTGKRRDISGLALRANSAANIGAICTLDAVDRPPANVMLHTTTDSTGLAGQLFLSSAGALGVPSGYGNIGATANKPLSGFWYVS